MGAGGARTATVEDTRAVNASLVLSSSASPVTPKSTRSFSPDKCVARRVDYKIRYPVLHNIKLTRAGIVFIVFIVFIVYDPRNRQTLIIDEHETTC